MSSEQKLPSLGACLSYYDIVKREIAEAVTTITYRLTQLHKLISSGVALKDAERRSVNLRVNESIGTFIHSFEQRLLRTGSDIVALVMAFIPVVK